MELLGALGRSWALLGAPGRFWSLLGAPERSWALLGAPGRSWALLGAPGRWGCGGGVHVGGDARSGTSLLRMKFLIWVMVGLGVGSLVWMRSLVLFWIHHLSLICRGVGWGWSSTVVPFRNLVFSHLQSIVQYEQLPVHPFEDQNRCTKSWVTLCFTTVRQL